MARAGQGRERGCGGRERQRKGWCESGGGCRRWRRRRFGDVVRVMVIAVVMVIDVVVVVVFEPGVKLLSVLLFERLLPYL